MLLVFSELQAERERLEEEFKRTGSYYAVPPQQAHALAQLIASVTYEYCHDHPPQLLIQIEKLLTSAINNTYSLTLYRQVVEGITHQCKSLQMYRQHLHEMNEAFALDDEFQATSPSFQDQGDKVFELAQGGQEHTSRPLESADFQEVVFPDLPLSQLPIAVSRSDWCDSVYTEKTMQSDLVSSSTIATRYGRDSQIKFPDFYGGASAIYTREDWKTNRGEEEIDGSREIDSFRKRGNGIIESNKNLKTLMIEELRSDVNRELILSRSPQKDKNMEELKYNKKMREKLLASKLKSRKKL